MEPPEPRLEPDPLSDSTEPGEALDLAGEAGAEPESAEDTLAQRMRRLTRHPQRPRELSRGESVGRYVILEKLGAGAMGVVHAAWDPDLDRKVALKLLHGQRHAERLLREAQAMARLSHPNVMTVHDVGEVEGRVFMAMEFVEGTTLAEWAESQPRTLEQLLAVFVAAGRGLAAAHERGLIHRDFKPDNVMIAADGRVRVMDFGLVRAASESEELPTLAEDERSALESSSGDHPALLAALSSSSLLQSRLTRDGSLLGTPAFMSPEQLRGEEADARSDQFAFCVALWECLVGQRPFAGRNPLAVLFAISHGEIREPPAGRALPSWLRRILVRGLAAEPSARWPDMAALLSALSFDPRARRRRLMIGVGSLILTGAVAGAALAWWPEAQPPPCQEVAAPLESIWSDARARELRERFAASGLGYAGDSAERVVEELDRWAAEWANARQDACEATELRREQSAEMLDLRMGCLDRRLLGFSALVELFAEADTTVIEKAVEAVEGLPRVTPCSDRAWLSATVRPPDDPAMARAIEVLDAEVARVDARVIAGKAGEARDLAKATDERARSLGWPATEARAALARGRVEQELGEFELARDSLERAYYAARLSNDDESAVIAATWLVYGNAVGLADWTTGAHWLRLAEVEAARLDRADLAAEVDSSAGIYWYTRDDMKQAATAFTEALERHERADSGLAERGAAHVNLGSVLVRVDQRYAARAIAESQEGIELLEGALGPDHPHVGLALSNFATIYGEIDREDEAIPLLERALSILQAAHGADHPITALTQLNLSANLTGSDHPDPARALELARASLVVHERVFGPDHSMSAESLRAIARALQSTGRCEEALEPLTRATAIWEAGPSLASAVASRQLRILCLLELGRVDDALDELDELGRVHGVSPARLDSPRTLLQIVEALLRLGARAPARELLPLTCLAVERSGEPRLSSILAELIRGAR